MTPPESKMDELIEGMSKLGVVLEKQVASSMALCEAYKTLSEQDRKKIEKLYEIIVSGNGKEPLMYVVDRHERTLQTQSRILWIILTLFIGQVFYGVWQHFIAGG
jgi:hypothetical protein